MPLCQRRYGHHTMPRGRKHNVTVFHHGLAESIAAQKGGLVLYMKIERFRLISEWAIF